MNRFRWQWYAAPASAVGLATLAALVRPEANGGVEAAILLMAAWVWTARFIRAARRRDRDMRETIVQLNDTVNRWASGDLEARVYLDQENPLDSLAHGMNRVAERLKERTEDLGQGRERLEAILSSMVNGIIILNHGLTITLINQAAKELFGIQEETVQGRHLLEVIRDVGIDDAVHSVTQGGGTRTVTWSPLDNDNLVVQVTIAAVNQPVGGPGAVLVARNISSERQVDRMRQDFVANVSHELQTPLTIIRGFTETLLDDKPGAATRQRFIGLIHDEATRMSRLVDDLLTLSRMEHHSLPVAVRPVDLPMLIESILAKLAPRADAAGLCLENRLDRDLPLVAGDADLLEEVFLNLVSNAVQYTPKGGVIRISAGPPGGGRLVGITVADTGIGIPASDVPRIFERFYRVDKARSRASGGTGLGLAIVKHIMELHHGRIEVKSTVGQGSEFTVYIPEYRENDTV